MTTDYKPLTDELVFPSQHQQQQQQQQQQARPVLAPPQQPSYTVLPNGQVQMTVTLPMGAAPPQYPYPYPYPFQPQPHQFQHPQFMQAYAVPPTYPMQPPSSLYYVQHVPSDNLAVANMVTFIVGMCTFIPHVISLIYSFIMVHKGYFQGGKKAAIIALSVIELVGWLGCASLSWLVTTECYTYGSARYRYCYDMWWGWITIVIWFGLGIACGIPRVVFTWQAAKQRQMALANPSYPNPYPNSAL